MNTQKNTYEKPFVEIFNTVVFSHLLNWSAPKDNGPGEGNTVEIEAKEFDNDEWGNLWNDELWED